jgi:hypothetical protein
MRKEAVKMFDFSTVAGRKNFIHSNTSSIYDGVNVEGEEVIVALNQGAGMDVKTRKHGKPRWYEVVEYDADGNRVSVSYESAV